MKRFLFICLLLLSSCSQLSSSGNNQGVTTETLKGAGLKLTVHKKVLENGLVVLVVENPILPIYSYYTFFDVGGRYESREEGTTGATHFLEHMMFKGAKKYGPHEFDSFIEKNGGSTNAYTTFDSTVYYENLPSHTLDTMIDMEADRLQYLLLEENAFESERLVVLEERKLRYENSPRGQLFQTTMQEVFKGTPYGGSVIGDESDVKSLSREQMMEFFKKFYTPDNAVIVIVGDVKANRVFKSIEEKFGHIPKASKEVEEFKAKMNELKRFEHPKKLPAEVALYGESPNPIFMLALPSPKLGDRKSYVLDVLSSMIGKGDSSYLNQHFVMNARPLLNNVYAGNYTLRYNGIFFIGGELLSSTNFNSFKKDLNKTVKGLCKSAVTERNLQKTKNQFLSGFYSELQSNSALASFLGSHEHFFGDFKNYQEELVIYDSITTAEVLEVCNDLVKQQGVFVSVWNKNKKGNK